MTLENYYASFKIKMGAFVTVFAALPLLSKILSPAYAGYGYPPLGNVETLARIGTGLFAASCTYFAYFARTGSVEGARKGVRNAFVFAAVCFVIYLCFFIRFVRTVEIPTRGTSVQVSVGFERSEFAKQNFSSETDVEMLRYRGATEEEVARLWTAPSIVLVRVALFLFYTLVLCGFVCALSWGVVADMRKQGNNGR